MKNLDKNLDKKLKEASKDLFNAMNELREFNEKDP